MADLFDEKEKTQPFDSYEEYMEYLFACVNEGMNRYLTDLKRVYATGEGGYKNVLYPDLEIVHDLCVEKLEQFQDSRWRKENDRAESIPEEETQESSPDQEDDTSDWDELFSAFAAEAGGSEDETGAGEVASQYSPEEMIDYINARAALAGEAGVSLPFYEICRKLNYENFTIFCLACGILSSTQTDYAGVFQVINENGSLSAPTIESAAKLYYGSRFSITGAYGDMSVCLEQLMPILNLRVQGNMPFSTVVSPDKRMIDYLFGKNPMRLDEDYSRFFQMLTDDGELDPILANEGVLEAMKISYEEGVKIFSYYGDEGSGRKFFVKHFCREQGMRAVSINCKKLFVYDFSFVDKALWAVTRECILTNACCCLDDLSYREEEKEKFFGYMDLAFSKLTAHGMMVFAISKEKLPVKEMTKEEVTELELPTPSN
ncbi:MAG: hypothetical protein K2J60_15910, partial [Acetatifactor sp.]|nr:hypothetical protein [Acetatifactor sp.]